MATKTYFSDTIALSDIDVSKIYLDEQVKGQSESAASIVYERVPIKYKTGKDSDKVLTFELKTQGKINAAIPDGKEQSYTMILRTAKGMNEPSADEQANIDKLEAIEEHIQDLARQQKIPLKTSKNSKTEKYVDPDDLIILRRSNTQQGEPMNPVIFAKIFSKEGKIALEDNFRKLNTKNRYIETQGRCGIHETADPRNYMDGWMNLIAVVKVSGIFIGAIQNIQVRLAKVIIIDKIKNVPLINSSILELMPEGGDEEEGTTSTETTEEEESDDATLNIIEA